MFPKETRLPEYYNGKLIIYDWIRGWIKAVTMQPNGDFDKMEPFFGSIKLNNLIDMEVGPDGKLYLLEYGTGWFTKNPDAGLSRIDFNGGNRPPVINSINVDKTSGVLPFTIKATTTVKDLENDKISYLWNLGSGVTKETTSPELEYTFTTAGDYPISVEAKDDKGASAKSSTIYVYAGNEAPKVAINITGGNKSFYMPGAPVKYDVQVTDSHDTSKIDQANLFVSVDYVDGYDKAASSMGHQQGQANIGGRSLVFSLDCKSCHKEEEKSIGPAFIQVAQKYNKQPGAMSELTQKIIKGGSGVWGDVAMAAHPTLAESDVHQMVNWILSLANPASTKKSLPASGSIMPPATQKPGTVMVMSATYTDKGGNNIKVLTGSNSIALRSNTITFDGTEKVKEFNPFKYNGSNVMIFPAVEGWIAVDSVDLTEVNSLSLSAGWQTPPTKPLDFEIHLDVAEGKLIGAGNIPVTPKGQQFGLANIKLEPVTDGNFHTIYIVYKPTQAATGGITSVTFNSKQ